MIVCCGLLTVDVLQTVERLPRPDEKVVARQLAVDFGGPAANAAATAVALGSGVRLVASVGDGPLAQIARSGLDRAGVTVADVADGGDPALSTVLVTAGTGERAVVSTNATSAVGASVDVDDLARGMGPGDVLLVDGHLPEIALALAREIRRRGGIVVMDAGSWKPGTGELVAASDLVVASADFRIPTDLRESGRGVVETLLSWGPRTVAQSAGGASFVASVRGVPTTILVRRPDRVVDTLGAGDVLHGALAAFCDQGLDDEVALQRAADVATVSVGHRGARGWIVEP
ncbi:PfkB family carbohydrate kinase [Paraoerskovia marina]|uniref:PfkB family carbohydrate kinase n=1 Tax=Paraoerskovia marina TaxID=545619 RepID=UPI0004928A02|nr:PfkB family carbohydrate kinase [Paraoerskovia marina]